MVATNLFFYQCLISWKKFLF